MDRSHKTKVVATIGPASSRQGTQEQMLNAGMDIARLNFSHGDFEGHAEIIRSLRAASAAVGCRVAIMADLPGPKLRVGEIQGGAVVLEDGQRFTLTTAAIAGNRERVSVNFKRLAEMVGPGDTLYLNDGFILLRVEEVSPPEVRCRVIVGGELRSRKGLNVPGIELGVPAFTAHDRECLEFALKHGVDALSQSFVSRAEDVREVREAARALGHSPFVIAKIERAGALEHLEEIVPAADGIMVARGDLGVEIPIERIAVVQKRIIHAANRHGRPVITATHMLESMTGHRRPTRAEATDVANAILDGTDCVMLSGESAAGRYPVEAVGMLARIAAVSEPDRPRSAHQHPHRRRSDHRHTVDLIALSVEKTLEGVEPVAIMVPTDGGATARNIARFRLPVWLTALSESEKTCRELQFSYGVHPVHVASPPSDWATYVHHWLHTHGFDSGLALLTTGPRPGDDVRTYRMEIMELGADP